MIKNRMGQMCCGVDALYGGSHSFQYDYGYPATVNSYPEVRVLLYTRCVVHGARQSGIAYPVLHNLTHAYV